MAVASCVTSTKHKWKKTYSLQEVIDILAENMEVPTGAIMHFVSNRYGVVEGFVVEWEEENESQLEQKI